VLDSMFQDLLKPTTLLGAVFLGVLFILVVTTIVVFIRRAVRHIEPRLSDVTALRFLSTFAQALAFVVMFVL
jgi:hypothetical protein